MRVYDAAVTFLADVARHVIGYHLTQETRVHNACLRCGEQVPGECCSPRHRMQLCSIKQGLKRVWITWRATSAAAVPWMPPRAGRRAPPPPSAQPPPRAWQTSLATSQAGIQFKKRGFKLRSMTSQAAI